ncbi:MAG TPA: hypothetical protein VM577_06370 [Anaerovoracaceae bacterium]|nr:hypothetical protein [Anaerovoracaceae bacterium]
MSLFSKLFDKKDPHAQYMELELELEDLASSVGCSLPQLIAETKNFQDLESLVSIMGEEKAEEIGNKHRKMRELFPQLTPEQKAYHTQEHDDVFDEWRNTVQ